MSGGGTGLMSGGGESIGSIGRGKSGVGFCGFSMDMPQGVQQRCLSQLQLQLQCDTEAEAADWS
jgi:hypothetical protein